MIASSGLSLVDTGYGDVVDASFIAYPWLESRAVAISSYNPMLVPGLLQTSEYAEAVIRNAEEPGTSDSMIKRYVELRMERQQVLTAQRPPLVTSVLDEAVLRRRVGGSTVMRAQLRHLVELTRRPRIELRVLPSRVALHASMDGGFILFAMPDPYPAVAYVESLGGRLYIEAPKSDRFVRAYHGLWEAALDPRASAELIAAIAEEMS